MKQRQRISMSFGDSRLTIRPARFDEAVGYEGYLDGALRVLADTKADACRLLIRWCQLERKSGPRTKQG